MTVRDLAEQLMEMDPDQEVHIAGTNGKLIVVNEVSEINDGIIVIE